MALRLENVPVEPTTTLQEHNVRIRIDMTPSGKRTRVFLGDTELKGVRSIKVSTSVEEITLVHLEMYAIHGVTIEGIAEALKASVTTERDLKASIPADAMRDTTYLTSANRHYAIGTREDGV